MKKVAMIITDDFEEAEAVGAYAILSRGGIKVDVYSLRDADATGRFGLTVTKLLPFSEFLDDGYEAVILPGGPEYAAIEADGRVQALLADFAARKKFVCAICASPTVLGRAGLLKDRHYTCFTSMDADFGGTYLADYVVRDGKIITGKSAAASIDFGLAILEAIEGSETAEAVKAQIYYEERV